MGGLPASFPGDSTPGSVHRSRGTPPPETLLKWLAGDSVPLAVRLILASLFIWIPYLLIARSRRWWLYCALALLPVAFLAMFAWPVWVSPLTTSYKLLNDTPLEARIDSLATRVCGIEALHQCTTPGRGWRSSVPACLPDFGLPTLRWGFSELSDPASLPLILFLMTLLWLGFVPFFNLIGRHIEHEADRFGLELTHQNHAAAMAFAGNVQRSDVAPDWDTLFLIFLATHPSVTQWIEFANTYRPCEQGTLLVYGNVCRLSDYSRPFK